jgi:hypothetical protein
VLGVFILSSGFVVLIRKMSLEVFSLFVEAGSKRCALSIKSFVEGFASNFNCFVKDSLVFNFGISPSVS